MESWRAEACPWCRVDGEDRGLRFEQAIQILEIEGAYKAAPDTGWEQRLEYYRRVLIPAAVESHHKKIALVHPDKNPAGIEEAKKLSQAIKAVRDLARSQEARFKERVAAFQKNDERTDSKLDAPGVREAIAKIEYYFGEIRCLMDAYKISDDLLYSARRKRGRRWRHFLKP